MDQESKAPEYENEIVIGKVSKSFGVKGYLKIIPLTDFPERFKELEDIHLYSEKSGKYNSSGSNEFRFKVEDTEVLNEFIKLKLEEVNDKDSADKLRDYLVTIPIDERIERDTGEHYYYELIGCEVWDQDKLIGNVKVIEDFGGGDLFNVELVEGGRNVYIPYRDEFVERIDLESRKIFVKLIDGLIEA